MTPKQCAERLNCSHANITALIRSGAIAGTKTPKNGRWRVDEKSFEKYIQKYISINDAKLHIRELENELKRREHELQRLIWTTKTHLWFINETTNALAHIFSQQDDARKFDIADVLREGLHKAAKIKADEWELTLDRTKQIITKQMRRFVKKLQNLPLYEETIRENLVLTEKLQIAELTLARYTRQYAHREPSQKEFIKIEDCNLSIRALNCLKAAELETLGDICTYSKSELIKFRNFGKKSLNEIEDLLKRNGLSFNPEPKKF